MIAGCAGVLPGGDGGSATTGAAEVGGTTGGSSTGAGGSGTTGSEGGPGAWTAVAAGEAHICAIADDGTLWCSGNGVRGAVGPNGQGTVATAPIPVTAFDDWTAVAAGGSHTCAMRGGGRLYCFGDNAEGQLGLGAGAPAEVSAPTEVVEAGAVASVAAGNVHACAVRTDDGAVLCWGAGDAGQLGSSGVGSASATPVAVDATLAFVHVAAGRDHACAVGEGSGSLSCWGKNDAGQVGVGGMDSPVASPASVVSPTSGWTSVAGGRAHTCGIAAGIVYCWGSRADGRLGDGMEGGSATSPTGLPSPSASEGAVVAAGSDHTCVLDGVPGAIHCFGRGDPGQLGDGAAFGSALPVTVEGADWVAVAAGGAHTCGIRTDGSLWCWGAGDAGQLGQGDLDDRYVPVAVGGA